MLRRLFIKNYALIENLELDFNAGLTTITGETGAGKSILLGAFSLVLGQRADTQSILNPNEKCIVESEFSFEGIHAENFFSKHNFDIEKNVIIRREVSRDGKSRAFINDTPATLSQIKELGVLLVDVHSQHETLALNNRVFQLSIVDAYAGNRTLLGRYSGLYSQYKEKKTKLNELLEKEKQSKSEADYFSFLYDELEKAELKPGEQEQLDEEQETLSNADKIKSDLVSASEIFSTGEENIFSKIKHVLILLRNTTKVFPSLNETVERLQSAEIELKDIADELSRLENHVAGNPERLERISERLSVLFNLQLKHRVNSTEALINLRDDLENKISDIHSLSSEIELLESEMNSLKQTLLEIVIIFLSKGKKPFRKWRKS